MAFRAVAVAARACTRTTPRLGWAARRWAHPGAASAVATPRVGGCGGVEWALSRSVQVRTFAASASQIKELRAMTSAPISDCKKALNAEGVDGDMDKAVDWLRKNGVATATKKAGRSAAEGVVCVVQSGEPPKVGVIVEVNSETDFVGRNADFTGFVENVAKTALDANLDALASAPLPGGDSRGADCTVGEGVTDMVAKFRENLVLRRVARLEVDNGVVVSYAHNTLSPGVGKIAAMVAIESKTPLEQAAAEKISETGRLIAMHVVAASPLALSRDTVDTDALQREVDILSEQARMSGKPENIIEKMVQGRLGKFFKESVLTEQSCMVGDDDRAVGKIVASLGKDVGADLAISGFVRFQCGEATGTTQAEE